MKVTIVNEKVNCRPSSYMKCEYPEGIISIRFF